MLESISINSIVLKAHVSWNRSLNYGLTANSWLSYDSTTKNLSVFLTFADNPFFIGNSSSLKTALPEWARVALSAATGELVESHTILSWSFNSSLERKHGLTQPNKTKDGGTTQPQQKENPNTLPKKNVDGTTPPNKMADGNKKKELGLGTSFVVGMGVVICGVVVVWFIC